MNPTLRRNGITEFELPAQQGYSLVRDVKTDKQDAQDGTTLIDYTYRKYGVNLTYNASTREDFDNLADFLDTAFDNQEELEFKFAKVDKYTSYVVVDVELSEINFVGGSGDTDYYYSYSLVITEAVAR